VDRDAGAENNERVSPIRRKFLILLLTLACQAVHAGDWTICVDSNDWGVYTYPDHDGSLQTLVRSAAEQLGSEVHYVAYPWRRCELMAEKGEVDGLLAVPWTALSRNRFVFPMREARADTAEAVAVVDLVFLQRAGGKASWDGQTLHGLTGRVAHVQGYAELGGALDALGIPTSDDYKSDMLDVRALLSGRINLIATYADSADLLMTMPDLSGRLARVGPPFARLAYYVAFGKDVYGARRSEIDALWREIAGKRHGSGYSGTGAR